MCDKKIERTLLRSLSLNSPSKRLFNNKEKIFRNTNIFPLIPIWDTFQTIVTFKNFWEYAEICDKTPEGSVGWILPRQLTMSSSFWKFP